jgi:Ran GTPase-activating protein (RanGAP) involved in mRNA processing and transport
MNTSYKLLKLNTGDDLICKMEEDLNIKEKQSIFVQDPMVLNQLRSPFSGGIIESYTLSPWMALSSDEFYEIPVQYIVVVADIKEALKENYIKYVQDRKEAEATENMTVEEIESTYSENEDNNEKSEQTISSGRRRKHVH